MIEIQTRAERERMFHDAAYSDARRERVTRFYTVTGASRNGFRDMCVRQAAGADAILEYGCGQGALASDLAHYAHVTGIDISPVAIEHSARLAAEAGVADRTSF